jgi:NAD(P)-dependent dehydrogenase (short-subunit alcohol dehydrogenase family)
VEINDHPRLKPWCVVTGGAGSLALEAARALLEHGASGISLFDVNPAHAQQSIDTLRSDFSSARIIAKIVDVRDAQAIDAAVAETADELGSVNILLCFAGVVGTTHAAEMSVEDWNRILDINTTGTWFCAQAVGRFVSGMQNDFPRHQSISLICFTQTDDKAILWGEHCIHSLHFCPPCQLSSTSSGLQRIKRRPSSTQKLSGGRMGAVWYQGQQHQPWLHGYYIE